MKSIFRSLGIIIAMAVIGFSMTGCATNVSTVSPGWDQQLMLPCGDNVRDYTILGIVRTEETRRGILGFGIPFTSESMFLSRTTRGNATYAGLLAAARRQFPNANAVIGVQIDRVDSNVWIFTSTRRYTLTGLAVEFAAEPNRQTVSLD